MYITDWPDGSPFHGYVFGLCVYSAIERTPAAHAFAKALDRRFGPDTSSIKRAEHILPNANEVGELIVEQGFHEVRVCTVTKTIKFPSVGDYVRFQLVATPMAGLLSEMNLREREEAIEAVAAGTKALLEPDMTRDGELTFPQEAHVVLARRTR